MARPRLTIPDPDHRLPHPSERGATHILRRHIALAKAFALIMVLGPIIWFTTLAVILGTLRFGFAIEVPGVVGLFLIFIAFYVTRLVLLVFLPITY